MARRSFTVEFKASATRLVREQGYAVAQVATSLGVDIRSIRLVLVAGGDRCVVQRGAALREVRRPVEGFRIGQGGADPGAETGI
jgi:hypothetical protein